MAKELPELMESKEVCELLHIHKNTYSMLCQRGDLPAAKVGGKWYVRKNELMRMLGFEM